VRVGRLQAGFGCEITSNLHVTWSTLTQIKSTGYLILQFIGSSRKYLDQRLSSQEWLKTNRLIAKQAEPKCPCHGPPTRRFGSITRQQCSTECCNILQALTLGDTQASPRVQPRFTPTPPTAHPPVTQVCSGRRRSTTRTGQEMAAPISPPPFLPRAPPQRYATLVRQTHLTRKSRENKAASP
jgi:hypothetical protein